MTFDERAARLANHPDTVTVAIAGEERPWFLGKVTFDLAKAKNIELGDILGQFEDVDEDAALGSVSGMLDNFGQLLYFGMLPFQEDLELEEVTDFLSLGDVPRLLPVIMAPLSEHAEVERGKAQAEASKRAQSQRDRKKGRG